MFFMYVLLIFDLTILERLGGLKGGDHYEDLGVDGRTTLRWILGK
jgi:hypothetical protein